MVKAYYCQYFELNEREEAMRYLLSFPHDTNASLTKRGNMYIVKVWKW